jgi:superfamily I DNA and/or RNA helicase
VTPVALEKKLLAPPNRNQREVEIITKICEELQRLWAPKVAAGDEQKEIGVITFYGAQLTLLDKNLRNRKKDFQALKIRTGTVDRFQGMERAIVIVSMVRNNRRGDIGFAEKDERINVAFSRAQELLIIVGCHDLFCVRARQEDAAERYSKVASVVRNRGDFIDILDS